MEEQPVDEDELWSSLEKALRGAFEPFVESRVREGENLKKDLCEKLDNMVSYVDFIEERSPQIIIEYRARLEEKLRELLADNQLEYSNPKGNYIDFITKDGEKLGEFTNGKNSGWMYTLNGIHPEFCPLENSASS